MGVKMQVFVFFVVRAAKLNSLGIQYMQFTVFIDSYGHRIDYLVLRMRRVRSKQRRPHLLWQGRVVDREVRS